ncbi:MAG TPA: glycine/sarcosine/betaine reductase selenoprotein B family protein [Hyphomicrobiaceae bacterium]|nr:glycine/sarcosine/betaine reductase selenoprotein B family protein [Hyphomicrobiaceae bacterium]
MARIEDIYQPTRDQVAGLAIAEPTTSPWVAPKPLFRSTIALVTSAALHPRSTPPFAAGSAEFRKLPASTPASDLVMSHISINYDRGGFQRDINTVYPVDRMGELVAEGIVGALAPNGYSVMGSTDPATMSATADAMAADMREAKVEAALFLPV